MYRAPYLIVYNVILITFNYPIISPSITGETCVSVLFLLLQMVFSEDEKMQLASLRITKFNQSRAASSATAPPDLTKLDVEAVLYVHKLRVMVLQAVIEGALVRPAV